MADQNAQIPVDETPISPSRPNAARKNSLEQHLMHRPERQELVESKSELHGLLARAPYLEVCPAAHPPGSSADPKKAVRVSRRRKTSNMHAPENILPNSSAAPGLQAQQKEVS